MATLSWLSVALLTGRVVAELNDLVCDSVSATLGRYESTTASLPLPTAPADWDRATMPYGSALVLLEDGVPVWGGIVTGRNPGHGDVLSLSLATAEAYFARRYVGDVTYAATGQNTIASNLVTAYAVTSGIPFRIATSGAGTVRDRTYTDASDQFLYDQLQELSGVSGGPEWTVTWEHQSSPERYTPVFTVADRIGTAPMAGLRPAVTFDMPGSVASFEYAQTWAAGQGATSVVATGTAQADVRPQSPAQVATDPDRPQIDYRWNPSSSITDVPTLTAHASKALASLSQGGRSLSMTVDAGTAPKLNVDWSMGDTVGYDLTCPAFPNGLTGTARVVGWSRTLGPTPQITPTLVLGV